MSARAFLDTNVLVYTFDAAAPAKRQRAGQLVETALADRSAFISSQVVQEFLNVATRRFASPMTWIEARTYLHHVLSPLCEVLVTPDLCARAMTHAERFGFRLYDALIVAAAQHGGAGILYTEDLQHGQVVDGLRIVDPFRPG